MLSERRKSCEITECYAVLAPICLEARITPEGAAESAQRIFFESQDGIAVDAPLVVERAAGAGQRLDLVGQVAGTGHILHAQIEQTPEATGARAVRARLLGDQRQRGREWVDEQD